MNKLITTLLIFMLPIIICAETKKEWECRMAMQEYELMRKQSIQRGSQSNNCNSDPLLCGLEQSGRGVGESLNRMRGIPSDEDKMKAYHQWISQNCF